MSRGMVYLVGAGPGDPGLITVRGAECLSSAEVIIADRLVDPATIARWAPLSAEVVTRASDRRDPGQEELNQLLIQHARAGRTVVRLKGGDPFVFGRGGEEAEALRAAGIDFEVVPGVSAAIAAPAYAGIPLTHRGIAGVVAFATGHEADLKEGGAVDWESLARGASTLVLYMSLSRLEEVARRLMESGRDPATPVAVIEQGTTPRQRTIVGTLQDIAARAGAAGIRPPALTIVGEVVRLRETIDWFTGRPLAGRRLLVLATKRSEVLQRRDGARVSWVSPMQVVPRYAEVKGALGRMAQARVIAFTSAHGVDALCSALMGVGRDVRALAGLRLAAVGPATARRLGDHGLVADLVSSGGGAALAEELLAVGEVGPVILIRALKGRDELVERLRAAGVKAAAVDAYETVPDDTALQRVAREHRATPFDAIAFASPRGVEAFAEVLGGAAALKGTLVGSIGETTRAALEARHISVDVSPDHPELDALVDALCARLARELTSQKG